MESEPRVDRSLSLSLLENILLCEQVGVCLRVAREARALR